MEFKRTTEILVETKRRIVVRQPEEDAAEQIACPNCAEPLLAAEQIAVVFGISRRAVYKIVETGTAHFIETKAGILLICPASLTEILASRTEITGEKS